mgnify:CR=1 FL=1
MKTYTVYFYVKANRTEYMVDVEVQAQNAKLACALVKTWYKDLTGRNAFRPTTKYSPDVEAWYQKKGNRYHMSMKDT